jgi:2-C-methyl-D-erythritol 2,4-cyclodiphosphate synthase
MNIRVGNGYDVHAFDLGKEGNHIMLGGVSIPHHHALKAHSDGDVLIHALCDALLGALALEDIGHHFPDTDSKHKNVDSKILLKKVMSLIDQKGYQLNNCDCTIVAQTPKMAPYILSMREVLADILKVDRDAVSIKATTTEKLGFTGREEGIATYAVVLLTT